MYEDSGFTRKHFQELDGIFFYLYLYLSRFRLKIMTDSIVFSQFRSFHIKKKKFVYWFLFFYNLVSAFTIFHIIIWDDWILKLCYIMWIWSLDVWRY